MHAPMNRVFHHAVLLAGLACIAWVGSGYVGSGHLLALGVTGLIAAFFLLGAVELQRFRASTATLTSVLQSTTAAPSTLPSWLERLPAALRHTVRQRIEGQRAALPGPTLAPYLAGFLVLLGMLGTFFGMVVTLRGTGLALQGATDLTAVRAALAEPVSGLGVAFGTSLAGVAGSATLGLAAALARRERQHSGRLLDQLTDTVLRPFSDAQRRDDSFQLLRQQSDAMPALVERLDALVQGMDRQSQALHQRLLSDQQGFHSRTEAAYTNLAGAVDRSLKDSLAESARLAGAAIQPAVEATMAGVAREAAALHAGAAQGVQQQLEQLAQRFASSAESVAHAWDQALAEQRRQQAQLSSELHHSLGGFTETFSQRSAALVDQVSSQLARTAGGLEQRWYDGLAQQAQSHGALAQGTQESLASTAAQFTQHAAALLHSVEDAHQRLQQQVDARDAERLSAWSDALAQHERATQALASSTQQALSGTAAGFGAHVLALQQGVAQAHADLQQQAAARHTEQLAAWSAALERHERSQQATAEHTRATLEAAASGFTQQVASLQEQVLTRDNQRLSAWTEALGQHERAAQALVTDTQASLRSATDGLAAHAQTLQHSVAQAHAELLAQTAARQSEQLLAWNTALQQHENTQQAIADHTRTALEQASSGFAQHIAALQAQVDARDNERLAAWTAALGQHERTAQALVADAQGALRSTADGFAAQVQTLQHGVAQAHADLQADTAARHDAQRSAWDAALARQEQAQQALLERTNATLHHAATELLQHIATVQEQVEQRDSTRLAAWTHALAQHEQAAQTVVASTRDALADTASGFSTHAQTLQDSVAQAHSALQDQVATSHAELLGAWNAALQQHDQAQQSASSRTSAALDAAASGFVQQLATLQDQIAARDNARLSAWTDALTQHERAAQAHGNDTRQALASAADGFAHHAAVLQATITQAHADLQAQASARDGERLAAWNERLQALAAQLHTQWQTASADALEQQQRICATLADTAQAMGTRAEAQASATVAEIGRLVDAAAQAPRAAAEVIGELRDKLTDSMARDNAMLDERARMLDTLNTLLEAVQHASHEQRGAIDALVQGTAELMERAGNRFAEQVDSQGGRLADAATQLGAGAAEVASLGETLGAAVQQFSASNAQLGAHLQQVDDTLAKSIARSDEQLAYYVAQAREVIDLSLLSQKQIVEDLQRIAQERNAQASAA
jgi:hypothetical protein